MWNFKELEHDVQRDAESIHDSASLESFRLKYLSRKGLIAQIYAGLSSASPDEKPAIGKGANDLKELVTRAIDIRQKEIERRGKEPQRGIDVTMPGVAAAPGNLHILTQTMEEICLIFERLGFMVKEGPEMETEFNNFSALNIP